MAELRTDMAELRADLHAELHREIGGPEGRLRTDLHRQTVWLLGVNVTTLAAAVGLAGLVA